jgi:dTDP-4-dehydrorhamnose reductase
MKPRILLMGATGQIGSELAVLLPKLGEVIAPNHMLLDLAKPDDISRTIGEIRPNLIINAAAYTAVDKAESEASIAWAVNAKAPALMAQEAKKIGAGILHYSTDYVFDGSKDSPYTENDVPNPISVYGKTKLAGEQAIRDAGIPHLIFRTAWVYATRGRNFLLTVLRLASQHEELRIVRDQIGSPTWCREIGLGTVSVLERLAQNQGGSFSLPETGGTYHMTAGGATTWYDFTRAILDEASKAPPGLSWLASAANGRPFLAPRVIPVTTAEYPTPAQRPAYSVLSNSLLHQSFGVRLPDWPAQLHSAFLDDRVTAPLLTS